jgi:hypothetical protein
MKAKLFISKQVISNLNATKSSNYVTVMTAQNYVTVMTAQNYVTVMTA